MINDPYLGSRAEAPRGAVLINSDVVKGLISFQVDSNSQFQADTFRAKFVLSEMGLNYWGDLYNARFEAFAGFPIDRSNFGPGDLKRKMVGQVDDIEVDIVANEVSLLGRDLTAALIDSRSTVSFSNRKSSEIAQTFAAEVGLKASVTETKRPAGAFFREVVMTVVDTKPKWDILNFLAQQEGYEVWVDGDTLHFHPRSDRENDPFYAIVWHPPTRERAYPISNAMSVTFRRNLTLARTIRVVGLVVFNGKRFQVSTERTRIRNRVITGQQKQMAPTQQYSYNLGPMSKDAAQKWVEDKATELSRHEMILMARLPGDDLLTARTPVRLTGTGSAFDQLYYASSLVHSYSDREGYVMSLDARNHSPESQAVL